MEKSEGRFASSFSFVLTVNHEWNQMEFDQKIVISLFSAVIIDGYY